MPFIAVVGVVSMKASAARMLVFTVPEGIRQGRRHPHHLRAQDVGLNGSVPLFGFGATDTFDVVGPVLSTTRLTVIGAPQLPAAS